MEQNVGNQKVVELWQSAAVGQVFYSGLGKIDCNRYSLVFVHRMHWSLYFFEWVSNMALSLLFFGLNRYSVIDSFRRDYFISL